MRVAALAELALTSSLLTYRETASIGIKFANLKTKSDLNRRPEIMKAVIFAGGFGTRLGSETQNKPKPMVAIGGNPILWHILKLYSHHGINDFIICCGHMGEQIKDYFLNYVRAKSDLEIQLDSGEIKLHSQKIEPWKITLANTGISSMTGGRLKKVEKYLDDSQNFCLTYGDGIGDIDIASTIKFHKAHGKLATITTASPPSRFGHVEILDDQVTGFQEKPNHSTPQVNAGFFVLSKKVLRFIDCAETIWEREPLQQIAKNGQLRAYNHLGFWQPMDTLSDKNQLEKLWNSGQAPWKIWN